MRTYKKFIVVLMLIVLCLSFCSCAKNIDEGLLRLHIRANSNSQKDQDIKLKVRDEVVLYLEKELANITTLPAALSELEKRINRIEQIATKVLRANGFEYGAKATVVNEFFPARMYDELVVESGYYDALIIELGSANGDNWWCVIYPPLCYLEAQGTGDFAYKSKIKELWDKYFG